MNTASLSIRSNALSRSVPIAFAIAALAFVSARAYAYPPDQITLSAPVVKVVGYEQDTQGPIKQSAVTAHVRFDPVTLTTNSGVALLKDSVEEAARKACVRADRPTGDDDTCIRNAVEVAKPQVAAAIARARSTANG
jgi:UrcA family protein